MMKATFDSFHLLRSNGFNQSGSVDLGCIIFSKSGYVIQFIYQGIQLFDIRFIDRSKQTLSSDGYMKEQKEVEEYNKKMELLCAELESKLALFKIAPDSKRSLLLSNFRILLELELNSEQDWHEAFEKLGWILTL